MVHSGTLTTAQQQADNHSKMSNFPDRRHHTKLPMSRRTFVAETSGNFQFNFVLLFWLESLVPTKLHDSSVDKGKRQSLLPRASIASGLFPAPPQISVSVFRSDCQIVTRRLRTYDDVLFRSSCRYWVHFWDSISALWQRQMLPKEIPVSKDVDNSNSVNSFRIFHFISMGRLNKVYWVPFPQTCLHL